MICNTLPLSHGQASNSAGFLQAVAMLYGVAGSKRYEGMKDVFDLVFNLTRNIVSLATWLLLLLLARNNASSNCSLRPLGKSLGGFGYVHRRSIMVDYLERKEKEEEI